MRKTLLGALVAVTLATLLTPASVAAASLGRFEVFGVEEDDMLKMRAGPGIGYIVILGLPNGTVLRVHSCQPNGGTRWCNVSLYGARGIKGYASWAYLRKK